MNLQTEFLLWLKGYHPEADSSKRNGVFINTSTRLLYEGFCAGWERGSKGKETGYFIKDSDEFFVGTMA